MPMNATLGLLAITSQRRTTGGPISRETDSPLSLTKCPCDPYSGRFPQRMIGRQISDLVAVLGSMQIIAAELDR